MSKEIICVDGSFSEEALIVYRKYGVETPSQDILYNIRDLIINSNGETGFLLEELLNPKVPITHPILGEGQLMEPNWAINRFRNLDQSEISTSEVNQILKEKDILV